MLHKVRLEAGPLSGRIALVFNLKPEIHFRSVADDGTERDLVYRQSPDAPGRYVFEVERAADTSG